MASKHRGIALAVIASAVAVGCAPSGSGDSGPASPPETTMATQKWVSGEAYEQRRKAVNWYDHDPIVAKTPGAYRHVLVSGATVNTYRPNRPRTAQLTSKSSGSQTKTAETGSNQASQATQMASESSSDAGADDRASRPTKKASREGGVQPGDSGLTPKERAAWEAFCNQQPLSADQEAIVNKQSMPTVNGDPYCENLK